MARSSNSFQDMTGHHHRHHRHHHHPSSGLRVHFGIELLGGRKNRWRLDRTMSSLSLNAPDGVAAPRVSVAAFFAPRPSHPSSSSAPSSIAPPTDRGAVPSTSSSPSSAMGDNAADDAADDAAAATPEAETANGGGSGGGAARLTPAVRAAIARPWCRRQRRGEN